MPSEPVSELFDPHGVARRRGLRLHRHHVPPRRRPGHGARRLRPPRGPQRLPAAHRRRAVHGARPRPHVDRRRLRPAHRQRTLPSRRRLGVLLGRRSAHPRQGRLQVLGFRGGQGHRARPGRAAAHPRGAAADPVHAQGRHLRRARLGGRRRPQPAGRVRPHPGQRRARPLQADRRRRRQLRRRLRLGVPGPPGRPEVRPRDLLPRSRVLGRRLPPHGRASTRSSPTPTSSRPRWSGRRRSTPRARRRSAC